MKKLIKYSLTVSACFLINSCSPPLKKTIVGKWGDKSGTMEFKSDGSLKITDNSTTLHGKYTVLDGGQIKMEVNVTSDIMHSEIMQVEVKDNKLITTNENGEKEEANRIE